MTLEEVKDEVRWLIERCREQVENRRINTNKNRWITQGEWNAYENVLELLERIDTDNEQEDTDDE